MIRSLLVCCTLSALVLTGCESEAYDASSTPAAAAASSAPDPAPADTLVVALSAAETAAYLADTPEAQLVDVRTAEEVAESGIVAGATVIDFRSPDFAGRASEALDADRPVVLYCRSGNRAGQAADILAGLGYGPLFNAGGFDDLASGGFATEPAP